MQGNEPLFKPNQPIDCMLKDCHRKYKNTYHELCKIYNDNIYKISEINC